MHLCTRARVNYYLRGRGGVKKLRAQPEAVFRPLEQKLKYAYTRALLRMPDSKGCISATKYKYPWLAQDGVFCGVKRYHAILRYAENRYVPFSRRSEMVTWWGHILPIMSTCTSYSMYIPSHIYIANMCTKEVNKCTVTSEQSVFFLFLKIIIIILIQYSANNDTTITQQ